MLSAIEFCFELSSSGSVETTLTARFLNSLSVIARARRSVAPRRAPIQEGVGRLLAPYDCRQKEGAPPPASVAHGSGPHVRVHRSHRYYPLQVGAVGYKSR